MSRFSLKELGLEITFQTALDYVARRKWQVRLDGLRIICEGPLDDKQQPIVKFLPADESFPDYPQRLEDLISTLSLLEERPAAEIACEMAQSIPLPLPPTDSLADALIDELSRNKACLLSGKDPQHIVDVLRPLLATAELEIQQHPLSTKETLQQAALLASQFAKLLTNNPVSQWIIWRLCDLILSQEGMRLRLLPEQLEEFYSIARSDDLTTPDELLFWINDHVKIYPRFKRK